MAIKLARDHGTDDLEGDIVADINITPLVDIFLVLLIIFMVTSSVMSQMGVEVSLPKASQESTTAEPEGVIITLLPDGNIKINGDRIDGDTSQAIEGRLKALFAKTSSRLVVIEGDSKAFLGNAIQVMDAARKGGAEKFAIATKPE